ncbi:MAG: DUF2809 domain-containing protein [Fibrobacteria bacterium]|nr:DUF2809 domain-containing protein [Fibrobacteria bacterium]
MSIPIHIKHKLYTALPLVIITPMGLYSKYYTGIAENWVNDSFGGVLYVFFWSLLFYFWFSGPTAHLKIPFWVFFITCIVEISQLWHPVLLEYIRNTFLGRTILGTTFSLTDFPHYLAGALFAILYLNICKKRIENG